MRFFSDSNSNSSICGYLHQSNRARDASISILARLGSEAAFATHPCPAASTVEIESGMALSIDATARWFAGDPRFYVPDYAEASARESRLPDYRHTLLWLPAVETNGSTEVTLPFSTSDLPGRYRVTVEGITREGQRFSGRIYLLVEE